MEPRLTPRDGWLIAVIVVIAFFSLCLGFQLFPAVFPESTISFDVDNENSEEIARLALSDLSCDISTCRHASSFIYDNEIKVFLEKELGLAQADSAFSGEIHLWRWSHRWFQPLDREEIRMDISTTGQLAFFEHLIPEEAAGLSLSQKEAIAVAAQFLDAVAGVDTTLYRLIGTSADTKPHRLDHLTTWELRDRQWAQAHLRLAVIIQGDQVGGFRTYLDIPEAWRRSYDQLRSRNSMASLIASILTCLLIVGIAVSFVRAVSRQRVQWLTGGMFALVAMLLVLLSEANQIQTSIFYYDTTLAWSSWWVSKLGQILVQMLGLGLFVFLLIGGGEPTYRAAYPDKISLAGLFSKRGLRTRRVFISMILGFGMTAFFFAYQAVFYRVASLCGAWAPADVPYDNMLNTSLPWAFVLFIGFTPAVTEEFLSRFYAIPALSRLFRSRIPAVIIAALIWGFSHSGYPNQPFYIRGLEVGFAGIIVGVLMLRFGILAPLIWHYTVDALYTGILLLRSGNNYYVVSAAVAAGILLLPFIYALISYLRTQRFESPEGLLNRDITSGAEAEAVDIKPPPLKYLSYQPVSSVRWGSAFLITGILITALVFVPANVTHESGSFQLTAGEARLRGSDYLEAMGVATDSLLFFSRTWRGFDSVDCIYGTEQAGYQTALNLFSRNLTPVGWYVRSCRPLQEEEWALVVDGRDGRIRSFTHIIAESAPGDSLSELEARELTNEFLLEQEYQLSQWRLVSSETIPRPKRLDYCFIFEALDQNLHLGNGAIRVLISVQGGEVAQWQQFFKLPEEWVRDRESRQPIDAIRLGLIIISVIAMTGYLGYLLIRKQTPGAMEWRIGLGVAAVVAVVQIAAGFAGWERLMIDYPTSVPWHLYKLQQILVLVFIATLYSLLIGIGVTVMFALFPNLKAALASGNRRKYSADMIKGIPLTMGWIYIFYRSGNFLSGHLTGRPLWDITAFASGVETGFPFPVGLGDLIVSFIVLFLLIGLFLFTVHAGGQRRWAGLFLSLLTVTAFIPGSARSMAEFLTLWLVIIACMLVFCILAKYIFRNNCLSYLACALVIAVSNQICPMLVCSITRPSGGFILVGLALGVFLYIKGGQCPDQ